MPKPGQHMEKILLKPLRTEIQYLGQYNALAFKLLANPVPVYENLLRNLGKYGASLRNLKYEATNLSEANISCTLLDMSVTVRVTLDRLDVTFFRLDTVGEKVAHQIVLDAWNAVKLSEASIQLGQHGVTVASHAEIQGASYNTLLQRYVVTPPNLGANVGSGVVFYIHGDPTEGLSGGNTMLDRSTVKDGALYLKVAVVLDATKVSIEALGSRVDDYFTRQLANLGLEMERAAQ